ncbi:MAG: hypothetical protein ACYDAJ_01800 [Nitrosotalea sp.]
MHQDGGILVEVNHCIKIGLENNCSTLKKLSMLSYHTLDEYPIHSKYKRTTISLGRQAQMKRRRDGLDHISMQPLILRAGGSKLRSWCDFIKSCYNRRVNRT